MKLRTVAALLLTVSLMLHVTSCKKNKTIEYCELGIVLSDDFEPYDSDGAFNAAYSNADVIVGIHRYSFVDCHEYGFLSTLSPEVFAEVFLEKYGADDAGEIISCGDVPYYTYTMTDTSFNRYTYMPTFYRTPYAYFVITFITPSATFEELKDVLLSYTQTVYILEEHF